MLDELKLIEAITPDILAVLQERYRIYGLSIGCNQ